MRAQASIHRLTFFVISVTAVPLLGRSGLRRRPLSLNSEPPVASHTSEEVQRAPTTSFLLALLRLRSCFPASGERRRAPPRAAIHAESSGEHAEHHCTTRVSPPHWLRRSAAGPSSRAALARKRSAYPSPRTPRDSLATPIATLASTRRRDGPFRRPQSAGRRRGHAARSHGQPATAPLPGAYRATPLESQDTLAERLRRRPAKPMGSPRVGSNPTGVACPGGPAQHSRHMLDRAGRAPPSRHCRDWRRQAFLPSAPAALRATATAAALARASCQKIGCGWAPLGGAASDKRKFATLPTSRDSSAGRASD